VAASDMGVTAGTMPGSLNFPQAVISSPHGGPRTVTVSLPSNPSAIRIEQTVRGGGDDMASFDQFDSRLRTVEQGMVRIETKLEQMPTKVNLLVAVLAVLIPVLGTLVAGYFWIAQQLMEPLLKGAGGS
jgi:uncharacterized protein YneF (UPF0154 family)